MRSLTRNEEIRQSSTRIRLQLHRVRDIEQGEGKEVRRHSRGVVYTSQRRDASTLENAIVENRQEQDIAHSRDLARHSRCASLCVDDYVRGVVRVLLHERNVLLVHVLDEFGSTRHPRRSRSFNAYREGRAIAVIRREVESHRRYHTIRFHFTRRLLHVRMLLHRWLGWCRSRRRC